ncbi:hypothetical protein BJ165DRAFT_1535064 [Panaeolus papilionaceus]|nr:hypothetical protein BJ165DRAFT_1535064 [Panaeolus papilionaceus]
MSGAPPMIPLDNTRKPTKPLASTKQPKTKFFYQPPGTSKKRDRQELKPGSSSTSKLNPKSNPPSKLPATTPPSISSHHHQPLSDFDNHWLGMGDRPAFQSKNQSDYLKEFIDHVGEAIPAYIHHEYLHPSHRTCPQCQHGNTTKFAIWRCRDCFVPHALCRGCIRQQHLHNPFHKIECWTGTHFRRAELWEVGSYLVVSHHDNPEPCISLKNMITKEEQDQKEIDEEQQRDIALNIFPIAFPMEGVTESGQATPRPAGPDCPHCASDTVDGPNCAHSSGGSEHLEGAESTARYNFRSRNPHADSLDTGLQQSDSGSDGSYTPSMAESDNAMDVDEDDGPTFDEEVLGDLEFDKLMEQAYRAHGLKNYVLPEKFLFDHAVAFEETQQQSKSSKVELIDPDVRQPSNLMRIAHSNGYHRIKVLACTCQGESGSFGDFVAAGFVPASFSHVNTLFTRQLLDFARLANLELTASVYQIHQLLVQQTQPLGYILADDLYPLLRRLLRVDRWIKKLKWAACPQPGINLPPEWKSDENQQVYGRSFVADGNFKADHIAAATRADETPLYDGGGMTPHSKTYKEHIQKTTKKQTKAPCDNTFRAIESSKTASKVCDITGVVGIACARHGIYCPNGLVDLYRGEQQKNVDFAFVQALVRTKVDVQQRVTIIYDIACQYSIHLREHIDGMLAEQGLEMLEIDWAIGLFHVHAHNDKCYFRYSPCFIPGLGIVDGEIMETNWSVLNRHSQALRTANQVGRLEGLDDYTSDLNYKRTMDMPQTLQRKYALAKNMVAEHKKVFDEVSLKCKEYTSIWTAAIEQAEAKRLKHPAVMDIYGADPNKMGLSRPAASNNSMQTDLERYFSFALLVEDMQTEVIGMAKQFGKQSSDAEAEKLEAEREDLRAMLGELHVLEGKSGIQYFLSLAGCDSPHNGLPEHQVLFLPSNKNVNVSQSPTELRIQHLHTLLDTIRDLVVERSLEFSHVMQGNPSKGVMTRSRGKAQNLDS